MKLIKSVCTNLFFPDSRRKIESFHEMTQFLSNKGIDTIEFYHDGIQRSKVGKVLDETGLNGVYIAVIPSKEKGLHLCDEDEKARVEAVNFFKYCIDEAQNNGINELMINSGKTGNSISNGLTSLTVSVEELFNYINLKNYRVKLLMEPCDSQMDACQLIGPYHRTLKFIKTMHDRGLPLKLTMDSAHTVEEGEDFLKALTAVKEFCNQIHFANCYIKNPKDPLFGDKHLGFEYPDTEWTVYTLFNLFMELEKLYADEETLRIGLEVLCRTENPYDYFEKVWDNLSFLHKNLREK